jgi:hypothetical protein
LICEVWKPKIQWAHLEDYPLDNYKGKIEIEITGPNEFIIISKDPIDLEVSKEDILVPIK